MVDREWEWMIEYGNGYFVHCNCSRLLSTSAFTQPDPHRSPRMAEDELREQLSADGFVASKDSFLARYNDPFTPPIVRRNEVLVR